MQLPRNLDFVHDTLFANEYDKHEESPEEVETVNESEEELEVAGVGAEALMVAVQDVVGHGEHPEETQHKEELRVEHLVQEK